MTSAGKQLRLPIVVHCDNQAVVMVINSGKTRDAIYWWPLPEILLR